MSRVEQVLTAAGKHVMAALFAVVFVTGCLSGEDVPPSTNGPEADLITTMTETIAPPPSPVATDVPEGPDTPAADTVEPPSPTMPQPSPSPTATEPPTPALPQPAPSLTSTRGTTLATATSTPATATPPAATLAPPPTRLPEPTVIPPLAAGSGASEAITLDSVMRVAPLGGLGRGAVRDKAWAPDGSTLAVASPSGVFFYGAAALSDVGHLATPTGATAVDVSPDGRLLAAALADGGLQVWDVASSEIVHAWTGHGQGVRNVAYSPDGRYLASGSADGYLRVWNSASHEEVRALEAHPQSRFLWLPGGRGIVSFGGRMNRHVTVWDVESGVAMRQLEVPPDVTAVALDPAGRHVAVNGSGSHPLLWDLEGGTTREIPVQHARDLAFSPDGTRLVTTAVSGLLQLWEVASGRVLAQYRSDGALPREPVFAPDGRTIYWVDDGGIGTWNPQVANTRRIPLLPGAHSLAASTDGAHLALIHQATLAVVDLGSGAVIRATEHAGQVAALAYSPDGARLAVGSWDGLVQVWDLTTAWPLRLLSAHRGPAAWLTFSPDGGTLASAGVNEDHDVHLWDLATGERLATWRGDPGHAVNGLSFSPDGRTLAGGGARDVILWDPASGQSHRLEGHSAPVLDVAYSPDGALLASGSFDETVILWEVASGSIVHRLPASHAMGAAALAFSPHGDRLYAADQEGRVHLWDVATGSLFATFPGRADIALSSDGALLALKPNLDQVGLWTTAQGRELRRIEAARPLAFSPAGDALAIGSTAGQVILWGVQP